MFLITPDGTSGGIFECDLWTQDCPDGEKCMPWASDGGTWNATRCSEIGDAPAAVGDECLAEGGGASGLDDCEVGSMCWDVDNETNLGTCVAMCTGDADNPLCEDPSTTCSIANGGALILCLPECFPLLQDCADGQACYPINDVFACAPDVSGEMGAYGDPCEFINVCDPGTACLDPAAVGEPNCAAAGGCCGAYCDLSGGDDCPGAALGQECTSPYAEGDVPPGYEDTGWCVIPA
ncbi:MAG: ribulose phosphate epimerase [Nannocystaceae bacterium]|nr:ribulose phosphate epimerase [Nannocystaceae bacterium]